MFYVLGMSKSKNLPEFYDESLAEHMRPDLFKALCDPVRISIVATLAAQRDPATVSELTSCCGIDFSGVSRHLKVLRDAGVVTAEKNGREVHYMLNTDELIETLHGMADMLDSFKAAAK